MMVSFLILQIKYINVVFVLFCFVFFNEIAWSCKSRVEKIYRIAIIFVAEYVINARKESKSFVAIGDWLIITNWPKANPNPLLVLVGKYLKYNVPPTPARDASALPAVFEYLMTQMKKLVTHKAL